MSLRLNLILKSVLLIPQPLSSGLKKTFVNNVSHRLILPNLDIHVFGFTMLNKHALHTIINCFSQHNTTITAFIRLIIAETTLQEHALSLDILNNLIDLVITLSKHPRSH
jgi:hypothetical protein